MPSVCVDTRCSLSAVELCSVAAASLLAAVSGTVPAAAGGVFGLDAALLRGSTSSDGDVVVPAVTPVNRLVAILLSNFNISCGIAIVVTGGDSDGLQCCESVFVHARYFSTLCIVTTSKTVHSMCVNIQKN